MQSTHIIVPKIEKREYQGWRKCLRGGGKNSLCYGYYTSTIISSTHTPPPLFFFHLFIT